jgi:hypothetical protein
MSSLDELEKVAKEYMQQSGRNEKGRAAKAGLAEDIIDKFSSVDFQLPLKEPALTSKGATTYIYENGSTYPATFELLAEILHTTLPIAIQSTKLGPGEVIVEDEDPKKARDELDYCVRELKRRVHAKKSDFLRSAEAS